MRNNNQKDMFVGRQKPSGFLTIFALAGAVNMGFSPAPSQSQDCASQSCVSHMPDFSNMDIRPLEPEDVPAHVQGFIDLTRNWSNPGEERVQSESQFERVSPDLK